MRISDAIIIYLAIGSPLAVHYLLKSRGDDTSAHMLRAIFTFVFWPIYAISVTFSAKLTNEGRKVSSSDSNGLDAKLDKKVDEIASALEMFFHESFPERSALEYREIIDRYIGLTFAIQFDQLDRPGPLTKIVVSTPESAQLNSICLNRRNRKGLETHRNRARGDFVELVAEAAETDGFHSAFANLASELSRVISDDEACRQIEALANRRRQTPVEMSVNSIEKELWHSQTHKPSTESRI